MTNARTAFDLRHAAMRQNAGDWLLKNKNALQLVQATLVKAYYEAYEELGEKENHDPDFCCYLQETEDAIDLLASTIADLRSQTFWPKPEPISSELTSSPEQP
jgi:hypothetical protein